MMFCNLRVDFPDAYSDTTSKCFTSPHQGPPIGIDTPLVDSEGYPRGDIDVFRARTLRKRFIEIQNDHKSLTRKIEQGLVELQAISVSFGFFLLIIMFIRFVL